MDLFSTSESDVGQVCVFLFTDLHILFCIGECNDNADGKKKKETKVQIFKSINHYLFFPFKYNIIPTQNCAELRKNEVEENYGGN